MRGRETSVCGHLSCTPHRGPGLQPRHVPWLGIELATLWFAAWHSVHWATPAMAQLKQFLKRGCYRNSHSLLVGMQMVQPLWKTVWQFLTKWNILLSYDPTVLLLGIHPNELNIYVHTKTCTRMFIAALFIIDKNLEATKMSLSRWVINTECTRQVVYGNSCFLLNSVNLKLL